MIAEKQQHAGTLCLFKTFDKAARHGRRVTGVVEVSLKLEIDLLRQVMIPGIGRLQGACLATIETPGTVILHRHGKDEARLIALFQQHPDLPTHRLVAHVRAVVRSILEVGEGQEPVESEPWVGLVPAPEGVMEWMDGGDLSTMIKAIPAEIPEPVIAFLSK